MSSNEPLERRRLEEEYGISRREWGDEEWTSPPGLRGLFSKIREVDDIDYKTWKRCIYIDESRPWRMEMKQRVDNLTHHIWNFRDNHVASPGTVGHKQLKAEILRRFACEVTCPECTGIEWRREFELGPKLSSGQGKGVVDTKEKQWGTCSCNMRTQPKDHLSKLFGRGLASKIEYDHELATILGKTRKEPDDVFGLRAQGRIKTLLRHKGLHPSFGGMTLEMKLRTSPFAVLNDDCLFPFLIVKTNSTRANSSRSSFDSQVAFAARELLSVQQKFRDEVHLEDYDSTFEPLVWCFGCHAQYFEVQVAYFSFVDGTNVNGIDMVPFWSGDMTKKDDALRWLYITDIMFDWARDVYRTNVVSMLEKLTTLEPQHPPPHSRPASPPDNGIHVDYVYEDSKPLADEMGKLRLDVRPQDNLVAESTDFAEMTHKITNNASKLDNHEDQAAMSDALRGVNSATCAYRDAALIRSIVIGLIITEDNVQSLSKSTGDDDQTRYLFGSIVEQLNMGTVIVLRGDAISALETAWSGANNRQSELQDSSEVYFVLLTFSAYLTASWEQVRELCYLAVSGRALKSLCRMARDTLDLKYVKADVDYVMKMVEVFLKASIPANLAACLYRCSLSPRFETQTDPVDPGDNIFRDQRDLLACEMLPTIEKRSRDLIWQLHKRHFVGRVETPNLYLRVSSKLDRQIQTINAGTIITGTPWTTYNIVDDVVVAYSPNWTVDENLRINFPRRCIFFRDVRKVRKVVDDALKGRFKWRNFEFLTHRKDGEGSGFDWNRTGQLHKDGHFLENRTASMRVLRQGLANQHHWKENL